VSQKPASDASTSQHRSSRGGGGRRGPAGEPTRAVLLRSVDFGEADRILTLLTDRHGRVAVMARGARRSQKRFGGALEPFALIEASIALGAGDVGRLAEARVIRAFPRLLGSLDAMREGGRALELVRAVAPQREGEPRLVEAVLAMFVELEADPMAHGPFARCVLRVLSVVGLAPRLSACVGCGRAPEPRQAALFDPGRGGIVCRACGGGPLRLSGPARAWMMEAQGELEGTLPIDRADLSDVESAIDAFVKRHVRS
jgi:DNA repair protein RecO (recombination protein O)